MELKVISESQETPQSKTLILQHQGGLAPSFVAGQFLSFDIEIAGKSYRRCYSLSSAEQDVANNHLAITVKSVGQGVVSNFLMNTPLTGHTFNAIGPFGQFTKDKLESELPVVLIAAGSGITPIYSMLRTWGKLPKEQQPQVTLVYFNRKKEDVIFRKALQKLSKSYKKFKMHLVLSQEKVWRTINAKITPQVLNRLCPDLAFSKVGLCGPYGFMETATDICFSLGVDTQNLFMEEFSSPTYPQKNAVVAPTDLATPDISSQAEKNGGAPVYVTFDCEDITVKSNPGENLLKVANRAGVRVRSACEVGACGECRIKLASGSVNMSHLNGISDSDVEAGYILACCSQVSGNVRVNTELN